MGRIDAFECLDRIIEDLSALPEKEFQNHVRLSNELDLLSCYIGYELLSKLEVFNFNKNHFSLREIIRRCDNKRYAKALHYMIYMLAQKEILAVEGDIVELKVSTGQLPSPERYASVVMMNHPESVKIVEILLRCGKSYDKLFSGHMKSGLSLLFPDGTDLLLSECFSAAHPFQKDFVRCISLVGEFIVNLNSHKCNILEVGAGFGWLTWPLLKKIGVVSEYWFTDIGESFLRRASRVLNNKQKEYLKFAKFDIRLSPSKQRMGFPLFDVIVGANVMHASDDIVVALENMRTLLRPSGILCFIENTKAPSWINVIWGVLSEWWSFSDEFRTISPIISSEKWFAALQQAGFSSIHIYPGDDKKQFPIEGKLFIAEK